MAITKYKWWILAGLIISIIEALADAFADDSPPLAGINPIKSFVCYSAAPTIVLLAIPIWLPRIAFFYVIQHLFNIELMGNTHFSESINFIVRFLGDLFVCFLYFIFFQIVFFYFRKRFQNKLPSADSKPT